MESAPRLRYAVNCSILFTELPLLEQVITRVEHESGTGKIPLDQYLGELQAAGYDGWVGLEYKPSAASAESFDWIHRTD